MLKLNACANVYMWLLLGYTCYVVLLSVAAINVVPLRVAEDVFLLALAAFAAYQLVLDRGFYQRGHFLVVDQWGDVKSCKSHFPSSMLLEGGCRDIVEACHDHTEDAFRLGEEPWSWVGGTLTQTVIIVFKTTALWYERRMVIT